MPNHHEPKVSADRHSAVVHGSYDITRPPKHPGIGWTRFVCISDTHSLTFAVPPGDVLLHAGDLSAHGTWKDLEGTLGWLQSLPHPAKYFIAGNHDLCLDSNYEWDGILRAYRPHNLTGKDIQAARKAVRSKSMRKAGMIYLEHESAVYTSRSGRLYTAAPFYSIGAFQYKHGDGKAIYDRIPPSTDILMTHTPPLGECDVTKRGKRAGCSELADRLTHDALKSCRLHVYGHIHEAHGAVVVAQTETNPSGKISINAAMPSMPLPIIVDLRD